MAPGVRIERTTGWLTANCSTAELPRIKVQILDCKLKNPSRSAKGFWTYKNLDPSHPRACTLAIRLFRRGWRKCVMGVESHKTVPTLAEVDCPCQAILWRFQRDSDPRSLP